MATPSTSALPIGDPRIAAGTVAVQVVSSLIPMPATWIYVAVGLGAAVVAHIEMVECKAKQRRRSRRITPKPTLKKDTCWSFSWCRRSQSADAARTPTRPPTKLLEGPEDKAPASDFGSVERIPGCLNHRAAGEAGLSADDSWVVTRPTRFRHSAAADSTQSLLEEDTETDADEQIASALQPDASRAASAAEHMRFRFDSLLVWKRALQNHFLLAASAACPPPANTAEDVVRPVVDSQPLA